MRPGTAITVRLYPSAKVAVWSEPPREADSMMSVASHIPAIMRLRCMKLDLSGLSVEVGGGIRNMEMVLIHWTTDNKSLWFLKEEK